MLPASGEAGQTFEGLERVASVGANGATRFLYDGDHAIAEYGSNGAVLRRYVFGPAADEPLVWYEGSGTGTRYGLTADRLGSITAVTTDGGAAAAIDSYDEYGLPGTNNVGRFQFTGQMYMSEFGWYDYKARNYSPTLGRFVQPDPTGYADGADFYNYVHLDPVNGYDPSGLDVAEIDVYGCRGGGHRADGICSSSGSDGVPARASPGVPGGTTADGTSDNTVSEVVVHGMQQSGQPPKTNVVPRNALRCSSGSVSFYAPPSFDPNEITQDGGAGGLSDAGRAVGYRGAFDFQRVTNASGGFTFFSAYTNASNFAVGLYLAGTGINSDLASAISNGYSLLNADHFSSSDAATYRTAGIASAAGAGVTCKPAF